MKKVVIIGAGRRVQSHILPAVIQSSDYMTLSAIYARTEKKLLLSGEKYPVSTLDNNSIIKLKDADIIIICVSENGVATVLSHLLQGKCSGKHIFIDTPVFSGKNIKNYGLVKKFEHIFVLEDWLALNNFDLVTSLIRSGKIGKIKKIFFFHSGYRHHAVAIARRWTGSRVIRSVKHKKYSMGFNEFNLVDDSGASTWILEPRDYNQGKFLIMGESGSVSDYALDSENHYFIETKVVGERLVTTINHDDQREKLGSEFADREIDIRLPATEIMDLMKIDGLRKILLSAVTGKSSNLRYPVLEAVYDRLLIDCSIRWRSFYDIPIFHTGLVKFIISLLFRT